MPPLAINSADLAALRRIPGIGDALARRILAERSRNGPFADSQALVRVRGIGQRRAAELAPALDFRQPEPVPAAQPAADPDVAANAPELEPEAMVSPAPATTSAAAQPPDAPMAGSRRGPLLWLLLLTATSALAAIWLMASALLQHPGTSTLAAAVVLAGIGLLGSHWLLPQGPHWRHRAVAGWLLVGTGTLVLLADLPRADLPLRLPLGVMAALLLAAPWPRPALLAAPVAAWALADQLLADPERPWAWWLAGVWLAVMVSRHLLAWQPQLLQQVQQWPAAARSWAANGPLRRALRRP